MKNQNNVGYKNELKCFQCNEMVYRTTSAPVYADLDEHYKKVHGFSVDVLKPLRKNKNVISNTETKV